MIRYATEKDIPVIAAIYDRMNHVLSLGLDRRWRRMAAARFQLRARSLRKDFIPAR